MATDLSHGQKKQNIFSWSTKAKKTINLILGVIGTISFVPIIVWATVATLFADCPSCNGRIPFAILILAIFGIIFSIALTILNSFKELPYRVDTLFLLPAFLFGCAVFHEITGSPLVNIHIPDQFIIFALYSAGIAFLLQVSFIIWICVKFFSKKIQQAASASRNSNNISQHRPTKKFPVAPIVTPILESILTNDTAFVRTALQDHPDELNTAYAQNGNTPLHVAALNGYTDIVRLLLEQPGIDTTRTNNEGKTALDLANLKGHVEVAQLLENK